MPLSPKQIQALNLLRQNQSGGAVAKQLGVRSETVSRWRQLPAFQDALTAAEDPSYVDQDINVVNLKWKGFDTLMNLLDDHNAAVRLRAAAEIFKLWGNRLPPYTGPDAEPE